MNNTKYPYIYTINHQRSSLLMLKFCDSPSFFRPFIPRNPESRGTTPEAPQAAETTGAEGAVENPPVAKAKVGKAQAEAAEVPEKVPKDWQMGKNAGRIEEKLGEKHEQLFVAII
jgi:hypothetical protein